MNKKILIFIALILSAISILIIAVWGTLPEQTSQIPIETISFTNEEIEIVENRKMIDVSSVIDETNSVYVLTYEIFPSVAIATDLNVSTASDAATLQIDTFEFKVYVYYDISFIEDKPFVTITLTDKRTQKSDEVTLIFSSPNVVPGDDLSLKY